MLQQKISVSNYSNLQLLQVSFNHFNIHCHNPKFSALSKALSRMIRALLIFLFSVDGAHHPFKDGESVPVFVNKVGPYFNPHETYHYYSLPVCRPDEIKHRPLTLGEVLDGDRMAYSLYDIRFKKNEAKKTLCQVTLETEDIEKLKQAIRELYYFEFNIDNLRKFHFFGIQT